MEREVSIKKSKYEILLLSPDFSSKGGVAKFSKLLIDNLNSSFNVDHMRVGNLPGNRNIVKRIKFFIQTTNELRKRLRKYHYDMIQINPSLKIFSLLRDTFYLWIIKRHGYIKRTLVFFHGWSHNIAEKIISNPILKTVFLNIYKHVGIVTVLYNQCKQQLINIGIPSKKIVITSAMYKFSTNMEDSTGEKNGIINILFMSRLIKEKGMYIAAEVARLLVENGFKNFKFSFVGDGPEYKGLKNFITRYNLEDFIDAPGYVDQAQKEEILKKSHIFLFPTYYGEGCPAVLIEAMGAGLAVISTPVAAIPEIIRKEKNGLIVESKDPNDFYKELKRLIEDKNLLRKMQKLNKQKAKENYEVKAVTKRLEALYLSIIESIK